MGSCRNWWPRFCFRCCHRWTVYPFHPEFSCAYHHNKACLPKDHIRKDAVPDLQPLQHMACFFHVKPILPCFWITSGIIIFDRLNIPNRLFDFWGIFLYLKRYNKIDVSCNISSIGLCFYLIFSLMYIAHAILQWF